MTDEMKGKVCLVTGATSGIGFVTARELARQGATVVGVGRDPQKNSAAVAQIQQQTGNDKVTYLLADLSVRANIFRLADQILDQCEQLHVLVNNAGAVFLRRQVTDDGLEMSFALNHLAYFLLTNLLLDRLQATAQEGAAARVINVSSMAHTGAEIDFDDLQSEKGYSGMRAYGMSKLANVMFTYELARRMEGKGVTANVLHPGFVASEFAKNNGILVRLFMPLLRLFMISPEEGAKTSIYLASSPQVESVTGQYYVKEKATRSSEVSYDQAQQQHLWEASLKLTGLESVDHYDQTGLAV